MNRYIYDELLLLKQIKNKYLEKLVGQNENALKTIIVIKAARVIHEKLLLRLLDVALQDLHFKEITLVEKENDRRLFKPDLKISTTTT